MNRLPREVWIGAVLCWSVTLIAALGMAIPYWAGGHTWGIRYGRIWIGVAIVLTLPLQALYHRRFGSNEEMNDRLVLRTRQKVLGALLVVAGMIPGVVLIVVVAARAGLA